MKLRKVEYKDLKSRQKEVFNFHKIAAVLVDYGFNSIKLTDDWEGADFLAYQMLGGQETLKVQLKARITIDKKYIGKGIWITFPHADSWYLILHDELVTKVGETTNWLNTPSWLKEGTYNSKSPNADLLSSLADHKLS